MDQEKIGKFIANCRKNQNLTQEQLAEKLGITKNAVSKWERGICLMDMSLLKPLSEVLNVSVNEILSGKKLKLEDIKTKADENLVNLAELYDLKAIKNGTVALTGILLLLLLYSAKKNMETLPLIIIWFVYNSSYYFNKHKYTKYRKDLIIALLYLLGILATTILFFFKTL